MRKYTILLIILFLFGTGCGLINYRTELYIDGKKKAELKSNVPSKAKAGDIEIDQRGESVWEKLLPKNIKVEQ